MELQLVEVEVYNVESIYGLSTLLNTDKHRRTRPKRSPQETIVAYSPSNTIRQNKTNTQQENAVQ
jgi:hypothetical protein